MKREDPRSVWWTAARAAGLEEKLREVAGIAVYGEVYGRVQDLRYGVPNGVAFAAFDALDTRTRRYLDQDAFEGLCDRFGIPRVPVLHRGPWPDLRPYAEGVTVLGRGACLREGAVVRPVQERFHAALGRVILKLHGEAYLTRKGA